MTIRPEVQALAELGPLPDTQAAIMDDALLQGFTTRLTAVSRPVTDEEARILLGSFGPDECFGLAWTLLHLVESAPGWPIADLRRAVGPWPDRLRHRVTRAAGLPVGVR